MPYKRRQKNLNLGNQLHGGGSGIAGSDRGTVVISS
jgi:hypothetical protein